MCQKLTEATETLPYAPRVHGLVGDTGSKNKTRRKVSTGFKGIPKGRSFGQPECRFRDKSF